MAALVEWSADLSVGIEEIDAQHRVLVDLLNEFHEAIQAKRGSEAAAEVLRRLTDYTRIHFTVEESMMRLLGYPHYDGHKRRHEDLLTQVGELTHKLGEGHSVNFELLHFLKLWLTKHIQESDREYADHFLAKGVHAEQPRAASSWSGRVISRLWS